MCLHFISEYFQTMRDANIKPGAQIHIQCSFILYENEDDRYNTLENIDKFRELFERPSYMGEME